MRRVSRWWRAILAAIAAACTDPSRPEPTANRTVRLEVEVLAPRTNETVVAGRALGIRVRGREPGGQLVGLGYVARRFSTMATIDSAVVRFGPVSDTTHGFTMLVPPGLPTNTQIDIYGLAFGPAASRSTSVPQAVIVLQCSPGAVWCR